MTKDDTGGLEGPIQARIDEAVANQDVIFRNTFPGIIGVRITEASPGFAAGTVDVDARTKHPGGFAHGGAIAGFGDTIAAWATFPSLRAGEIFTTIEFKTNFLAGVSEGRLRAEGRAIHHGTRTMVIDVRISTDDEVRRPVAIMLVTQAIIAGKGTGAGRY